MLEAGAFGISVVAPGIGRCREMLEGAKAGGGHGGIITPLVDPEATGNASAGLFVDPDRRAAMGRVLRKRVKRHYDRTTVIDRYRQLYPPATATG